MGRPGGRPYPEKTLFPEGSGGWPAPSMEPKPPHDFCPEGPCPRAWHPTEGHLSAGPHSIRLERFPVFHPFTSGGGLDLGNKGLIKVKKYLRVI